MKSILIIGVARAGKSTLSDMIKQKYPGYNLVHSDNIKWAIIRANGEEKYFRENIDKQSKWELSLRFQKTLLEFFNLSSRSDRGEYKYILESGQLDPKYVRENVDFATTSVVCLGLGDLSADKIFNLCRKHDTDKDWTFEVSDEDLRKHSEEWFAQNEKLKKDCAKYGIKYIDTTKNREKILAKIMSEIEKEDEIFFVKGEK